VCLPVSFLALQQWLFFNIGILFVAKVADCSLERCRKKKVAIIPSKNLAKSGYKPEIRYKSQ
jgi:hypothetical protein